SRVGTPSLSPTVDAEEKIVCAACRTCDACAATATRRDCARAGPVVTELSSGRRPRMRVSFGAVNGGYGPFHPPAVDGYRVQPPSARRAGVSYYVDVPCSGR